jgi:hypothetical protein
MVTILAYESYSIGYGFESQPNFSPIITEVPYGSAQENYGLIPKKKKTMRAAFYTLPNLSISSCMHPSMHPSNHPTIYPSISLSICLSVCLSVCMSKPLVGPWSLFQFLDLLHSR